MDDGSKSQINAGNLRFEVSYRHFGGDRGPSVSVYAQVDGESVQLLRFDCFEKDPHYHYEPDGKNIHRHLDKISIADPVQWTLSQVRHFLPEMIRTAGYEQVAANVDEVALGSAVRELEEAIAAVSASDGR